MAAAPIGQPLPPLPEQPTKEQLMAYATDVATEHGLNADRFLQVITCESQWNVTALGDGGTSFGLVQAHKPWTKDNPYTDEDESFTKEQAYDPVFAINWMADMWAEDEYRQWSCYGIREKAGW